MNTPREEERTGGGVVKLTPVVTLDGLNGEAKLSGHPGKEVEAAAPCTGRVEQRKGERRRRGAAPAAGRPWCRRRRRLEKERGRES